MHNIFLKVSILVFICSILTLTNYSSANSKEEPTRTVEWYMAPENKAALEAKLEQCRNNPGELKNTPNCQNAMLAQHNLFADQPLIEIR